MAQEGPRKKYDPVIVVGTGRCGSSFVAGILHNKMNVCMGVNFVNPSPLNPDGYWEDLDFTTANDYFLKSYLTYIGWSRHIDMVTQVRLALNKPWGFKDPRVSELLGLYLGLFDDPKLILCSRDYGLTLKSLVRINGKHLTEDSLRHLLDRRQSFLKRFLNGRDYLQIHFTNERKTEEEVISAIKGKWPTWD